MRILVLGDFGGHDAAADGDTLAQRKIQRIHVDNFEDLLAKQQPTVRVPLGDRSGAIVEIKIHQLEDFHPDNLYRKLSVFHELQDLRKRLLSPETFAQAAAKLREALPQAPTEFDSKSPSEPDPATEKESDADTLDRILGSSAQRTESAAPTPQADISSLIDQIVAPYVVPGPDPRQEEYVKSTDAAVAAQLRSILHHDSFQSLEASWRGLHFLISNIESAEELQIYIWDVSKSELSRAIDSDSGRLEDSLLFQRLTTQSDEEPWSTLAGDFSFGRETQDPCLLSSLGAVAAQLGAPFLAAAAPNLLGSSEAWTDQLGLNSADTDPGTDNWQQLRSSPVASWIALAAPRFLLRLPYGAATDPIDAFPFEELEDPQKDHDAFLWGAPALVCVTLLATSFLESQWAMTPDDQLELGDLPAVTFTVDGEKMLKPCAEIYIAERLAESFLSCGVMPLLSFKNRNAIRLLRFQSIADPLRPLSGPWS